MQYLRAHQKLVHEKTKGGNCRLCNKYFSLTSNLSRHVKYVHEKKKPTIPCRFCDRLLFSTTYLKKHIEQVHEKTKNFQCKHCEKYFANKQNYERHESTMHDKISKDAFKCELCHKTFKTKDSLTIHVKVAHERKMVECDICFKRLSPSSLCRHKERFHNMSTGFRCDICSKYFKIKSNLRQHTKKVHENTNHK